MNPEQAHAILAQAAARALLNEADRLAVFEANRVLSSHLQPPEPAPETPPLPGKGAP